MKNLLILIPLAACSIPADYAGTVTQFNGDSLTIRGTWDGSIRQEPTAAMSAQASELCAPGESRLISSAPVADGGVASGGYYTDFLFACLNP